MRLTKDRYVVHPIVFEELRVHEPGVELHAVRDAVIVVVALCEPVEPGIRHGRNAPAVLHGDKPPGPAFRHPVPVVEMIIEVFESLLQEAFDDAQKACVELGVVATTTDTNRELLMIF